MRIVVVSLYRALVPLALTVLDPSLGTGACPCIVLYYTHSLTLPMFVYLP